MLHWRSPISDKLRELSLVVPLGLLFGWILTFPMFGPWLIRTGPDRAGTLGLLFLAGSIAGYAWSGLSLAPVTPRRRLLSASALALGTAVYFFGAPPSVGAGLLLFGLGIAVSPLVTGWAQSFALSSRPHLPLAAAIITSNVILLLSLTPNLPERLVAVILVVLPAVAVLFLPPTPDSIEVERPVPDDTSKRRSMTALGAFAVVTYFVGGVWYRTYAMPSFTHGIWLFALDEIAYMMTIAALAWWLHRRANLAPVATLTLSVLGLGLVLAPLGAQTVPRVLVCAGLAGTDYYYWLALWSLAQYLPPGRVFAWGLGFSLVQIALATLIDLYGVVHGYPRQALFGLATALTMALLPLVFSSRFQLTPAPLQGETLPPPGLTGAERAVFAMLARGAGDQEIADGLHISRHTVKFHVRNILRKCSAPNRKVLLSRMRLNGPEGQANAENG